MMQNNTEIAIETQQLSDLYTLQSILIEIGKNLNFLTGGGSGQVISVNGANLFQLAAQYYGDATLWTTIANANNLTDPVIQAGTVVSLVIPAKTTNSNGILNLQ